MSKPYKAKREGESADTAKDVELDRFMVRHDNPMGLKSNSGDQVRLNESGERMVLID